MVYLLLARGLSLSFSHFASVKLYAWVAEKTGRIVGISFLRFIAVKASDHMTRGSLTKTEGRSGALSALMYDQYDPKYSV